MAEKLDDGAIADGIAGTDWARDADAIVRDHEFDDFKGAMAFVNQVAEVAEAENHHPDILVHGFNKVRLTLSTHSVGGLTQADLDMAGKLDSAA